LADFGLSVFSDATLTSTRGGSLYWMSPELFVPERFGLKFSLTPVSDVYAFGCVCFEVTFFFFRITCSEIFQLYTGRPPFSDLPELGAMMKVIDSERQTLPSGCPAMSDTLWRHISAYWAQDPTARPVTEIVVQNMVWPPGPLPAGLETPLKPASPIIGDHSLSPSTSDRDHCHLAEIPRRTQDIAQIRQKDAKHATAGRSTTQVQNRVARAMPLSSSSNSSFPTAAPRFPALVPGVAFSYLSERGGA
jgi:serine/threonine protein kinase